MIASQSRTALRVRRALAEMMRDKVAGEEPQAVAQAQAIWGPGERWFTPEDPIWRVHLDATMFVGGIRALLLQSLHPSAMAGVAGHSGYRSDPWGRLQRTSAYVAMTTFGPISTAEKQIARIRAIHERVRGKTPAGQSYRASDPHLLSWVHVAEASSFLEAYQLYSTRALTPAEADRYVEQAGIPARLLGVPDPPRTVAELAQRLDDYVPELEVTPASRDAAQFLVRDPPLPAAARAGYGMLVAGAVASLPRWARHDLRMPDVNVLDRLALRPMGRISAAIVRWALSDPVMSMEATAARA